MGEIRFGPEIVKFSRLPIYIFFDFLLFCCFCFVVFCYEQLAITNKIIRFSVGTAMYWITSGLCSLFQLLHFCFVLFCFIFLNRRLGVECLPHFAIISTHEEAAHPMRHRETFALLPKQPSMMCPVSCCVLYEDGLGVGVGEGCV